MSSGLNRSARSPWGARWAARWSVASAFALGLAETTLDPAPAAAQERAALRGLIADEETGRIIPSARVTLTGTDLEARTGADGIFEFSAAPLGRVHVRVQAAGYPAVVEEVELTPGSTFVPILLRSAAAVLEELLVTTTRTDAPHDPLAQSAADLVSLHVPELRLGNTYVQRRSTPTRLGIRGRGTFTGNGEPTIVLDGAVLSGGIDVLRQIPADEVKSIRILKGPTAGFLYGSSDGVIYIETKSGPPAP